MLVNVRFILNRRISSMNKSACKIFIGSKLCLRDNKKSWFVPRKYCGYKIALLKQDWHDMHVSRSLHDTSCLCRQAAFCSALQIIFWQLKYLDYNEWQVDPLNAKDYTKVDREATFTTSGDLTNRSWTVHVPTRPTQVLFFLIHFQNKKPHHAVSTRPCTCQTSD